MLLHFRGLGFRAMVKLSAALSWWVINSKRGEVWKCNSTKFLIFMFSGRGKSPRRGSNVYLATYSFVTIFKILTPNKSNYHIWSVHTKYYIHENLMKYQIHYIPFIRGSSPHLVLALLYENCPLINNVWIYHSEQNFYLLFFYFHIITYSI